MQEKISQLMPKVFGVIGKFPFIEKFYWNKIHGFKSASMCAPAALDQAFTLAQKYKTVSKGDYYEFGIFKGASLLHAHDIGANNGYPMRFYGFDSFAGLPPVSGIDKEGPFYKGQYAFSKEAVLENYRKHSSDISSITLIEGYFENSLKKSLIAKYKMKKIAIAYIDCDLYSSTKTVLEFIKELLMKDSLLVFDDWNSFSTTEIKGEQLAFFEFQKKYPKLRFVPEFTYCWHGKAFRLQ
jgi:O-methyltransferase